MLREHFARGRGLCNQKMMAAVFDANTSYFAKSTALRILLVEDNEDSRELMVEILRRAGAHSIDLAASADEGLQQLRRARYDLLVTDLEFSDGSGGLETLDRAWAEGLLATTDVVVWSALDWLRSEAVARGAQFVAKPVDVDEVLALLRHRPLARRQAPESGVKLADRDPSA